MKVGDKVKYKKKMKKLTFGEKGMLSSIYKANQNNKEGWAVIKYPQNLNTNMVYAHSANLTDIRLI